MGSNYPSHHRSRAQSRSRSRTRGSSSRHASEPDRHHNLKTSLQVIGLLICMRVLLPTMFPSEHEREGPPQSTNNHSQGYSRNQGYGYRDVEDDSPPPPYSRAQLAGTSEIRRIEPAYPPTGGRASANAGNNVRRDRDRGMDREREQDIDGSSWDGTTAHGSEDESESEYERERSARRRERRREREQGGGGRRRDRDR